MCLFAVGMREESMMNNYEARIRKKYVYCPECGRQLLKSSRAVCDIICSKCKQEIVILVKNGEVVTFKSKRSNSTG